jgi:release factor glutamine methyltransferase
VQISTIIQQSCNDLVVAGITDSPKLDVELLLAHAINKTRTYLFTWPEKTISSDEFKKFQILFSQRLVGKPIAYILASKEFWGLNFNVNQHTLIPRPDTEILVEETLQKAKNRQGWPPHIEILDLGTGSGAIICALKHELPQANATAVDFQAEALAIAKQNALNLQLNIQFKQSDWLSVFNTEKFHIIVSNPPYIEETDPHLQQGDVRFEPLSALSAKQNGLADIINIVKQAKNFLHPTGWLLIEHGYNQAEQVQTIFQQSGYNEIETRKDYNQQPRITFGKK